MKPMLAIETSSESCSVALEIDGEVIESFEHAPMKHAELIIPAVSSLMDRAGARMADLDGIAFGRGPGSFTSLRIGIGVVQGLAWGAGLPVIPVSSLAAVAQHVRDSTAEGGRIVVAMDARMGEVFHGTFVKTAGSTVSAVGEERVSAPGELDIDGPWIAVGNGFERYEELAVLAQGADACLVDTWPRAAAVLELARHWLENHEALPAALAQPVYIRNNVAERPGGKA